MGSRLSTLGLFMFGALAPAVGICPAVQPKPQPPTVVGPAEYSFPVSLSDGSVGIISSRATNAGPEVVCKRTTDNGQTWSAPETVYKMEPKNLGTPLPLVTRDGRLQLFWTVARGRGAIAVDYFIDIWQAHSVAGTDKWTHPQRIFEGYVGSINGWTQLANGRIVLPFAYWVGGRPEGPPTGANITTVVYSDDGGRSWRRSPAKLTAPCYQGYNGSNYGACEPTILQLGDGRVWMLIRTQTGRLYESFSRDGALWPEPKPSRFCSSDSPAWLLRLPDRRIVLVWNNCENTSRINGAGVYTNRDALHAAISADEGRSWHGYREVFRDPLRNQSPPKTGDRGTAYPYAAATKDGTILMITGQGGGRRIILRIDPRWLDETHAEDDFSGGLDGWCVFKAFGQPVHWWRDRVQGPQLVNHPDKPGAKVLHVRRPDERDGDGAVWNFPLGRKGNVTLRLHLQQGFGGGSVALADRFIQPNDDVGEKKSLFTLPIGADARLPAELTLKPKQWHTLALHWDLDNRHCQVLVDGRQACVLTSPREASPGVSYLRLRSTAQTKDTAGMLIESVQAEVSNPL